MESSIQPQEIETIPEQSKTFVSQSQGLIQEALDRLLEQLERGMTEEMQRYLQAMARFHKYSLSNQILIFTQCPLATHVAGFRTWLRFKRHVKKGEKGIQIIAPVRILKKTAPKSSLDPTPSHEDSSSQVPALFFRVQHVFDIRQTEGPDLPQPTVARGDAQPWLPAIEQALRGQNIALEYQPLSQEYGWSDGRSITIRWGMSSADTFSTLIHEWAHINLHHAPNHPALSRAEKEWEADCVAYAVCARFGIDSLEASSDYILTWKGDRQALRNHLERIRRAATEIINAIEATDKTPAR